MVIFYSYVSLPNGIHLGVAEKQKHLLTRHAIVDAKTPIALAMETGVFAVMWLRQCHKPSPK